jgi:hypothetical protein
MVSYVTGKAPSSVFAAELDGNPGLDLAVANYSAGSVSIFKNIGNGTFQAKEDYGAGSEAMSVFCARLNADTKLDLAVANQNGNNVSVLLAEGSCCACATLGNLDNSAECLVTMGDLTVRIDHLFISPGPLACPDDGNLDLSANNLITLGDLTVLIDHLFILLNPLPACP